MARSRTEPALDMAAIRSRFPALGRLGPDGRPFVWADAPGGSQLHDTVIDAVAGRMRAGASNTHGAFATSVEIDRLIADAREAGADFLGCDPGEVVFGANATTLLFHLSRAITKTLRRGDEVVVTRLDHDANVRPWVLAAQEAGAVVRWADVRADDATLDAASFEDALSDRTRLVAFTLASNAVGTIPPAVEFVGRAKAAGALVVLDGVHLAQHRSIDLHATGADVVATSPYKFFGPHLGMLGVRSELLAALEPHKVRPAADTNPERWETGTQSHEALAGTIAAIEYVADIGRPPVGHDAGRRPAIVAGFSAFEGHEHELARQFLHGLDAMPAVRLIGIADPERVSERTPTFAIRVGKQHPVDTARALAERGIFVWDGHYYAIEVFDRLGLLESGGAVRIGFCHYHTFEEVDRVLEALAALSRSSGANR
jgi:cysteine desulfurase family protein (TIGR01976 family)